MSSPIPVPIATPASVDQLHSELSQVGIVPLDGSVSGEVPINKLRRSRYAAENDRVGLATLVEVDGVWYWQDGIVTHGVAGRRAGAGLISLFGGTPLTTIKFEKLGSNQIASKLEDLDRKFNPEAARANSVAQKNPGLRLLKQDGTLVPDVEPVSVGRILLFIHGTFSNNDNVINEIRLSDVGKQFLADVTRQVDGKAVNYDQVLTFDHYTVSRSPVLNALELARVFSRSGADIDIICHSRGGLVTRWFTEVFDHMSRSRRRAVFVGSPLRGTSLAAPDRLRGGIDLFTNLGKVVGQGLSLIPFTQVAGSLLQIVFSVGNIAAKTPLIDAAVSMIPGLAAMSRVGNNFELNALKDCCQIPPQYFAVVGTFKPRDVGWKFWRVFCDFTQRAAEAADTLIFRDAAGTPCANDLVVDTTSMTEYGFPANPPSSSICTFDENEHVYHTIYFRQPKTIDFIRSSLGIATEESKKVGGAAA